MTMSRDIFDCWLKEIRNEDPVLYETITENVETEEMFRKVWEDGYKWNNEGDRYSSH